MTTSIEGADATATYDAYLRALRAGDRRGAFAVIDAARAAGLDLGAIYMHVFQPALREIGRLWQENEITVADEHLATAITQAAMARVYEQAVTWTRTQAHTIVAACVDTERHEVGLRMLCDLLECEGWDATYLGATVPTASLVAMVRARRPDVLALSAALPPHLPRLREAISAVREALGDDAPLILAGGRALGDDLALATRLGADLTAVDAADAVDLLRRRIGDA